MFRKRLALLSLVVSVFACQLALAPPVRAALIVGEYASLASADLLLPVVPFRNGRVTFPTIFTNPLADRPLNDLDISMAPGMGCASTDVQILGQQFIIQGLTFSPPLPTEV